MGPRARLMLQVFYVYVSLSQEFNKHTPAKHIAC